MNLIGLNCTYNYVQEIHSPSNVIHTIYPILQKMDENNDIADKWIMILTCLSENAGFILDEMHHNTHSCWDIRGYLIDRHTVHEELQILAKDINKINNFICELLIRKPEFNKTINYFHHGITSINEKCVKLWSQADEMIFKSVQHSDHKNEELLLLAAKLDETCILNHIPKELINIFAITMFQLKLNDVNKACGAI